MPHIVTPVSLPTRIARVVRVLTRPALVFSLTACTYAGAATLNVSPAQRTEVARVCKDVMGFSPGEAHYYGCVDSLQQTLASINDAQDVQKQRMACADRGLQPGTRAFALCAIGANKVSQTGS